MKFFQAKAKRLCRDYGKRKPLSKVQDLSLANPTDKRFIRNLDEKNLHANDEMQLSRSRLRFCSQNHDKVSRL